MILKNGADVADSLVATVLVTLRQLAKSEDFPEFIALYDLARLARDRSYDVGFSKQLLQRWGLLDGSGVLHDSVRNIVLSAVEVDGGEVRIVNPRADT